MNLNFLVTYASTIVITQSTYQQCKFVTFVSYLETSIKTVTMLNSAPTFITKDGNKIMTLTDKHDGFSRV